MGGGVPYICTRQKPEQHGRGVSCVCIYICICIWGVIVERCFKGLLKHGERGVISSCKVLIWLYEFYDGAILATEIWKK